MVMPKAPIDQRPDIVNGWLEAELDAQLFFADEKDAMAVSAMAFEQTTGFTQQSVVQLGLLHPSESGRRSNEPDLRCPNSFSPEAEGALRQGGGSRGGDLKHPRPTSGPKR